MTFFVFLLTFLAVPLVQGTSIAFTWGWFVVPVTGLHDISIPEGVGLSIFFSIVNGLFNPPTPAVGPENDDAFIMRVAGALFDKGIYVPLLLLALGWVWHFIFFSAGS